MQSKALERRQLGAADIVWSGAQGALKRSLACSGKLAGDLELVQNVLDRDRRIFYLLPQLSRGGNDLAHGLNSLNDGDTAGSDS